MLCGGQFTQNVCVIDLDGDLGPFVVQNTTEPTKWLAWIELWVTSETQHVPGGSLAPDHLQQTMTLCGHVANNENPKNRNMSNRQI